MGFSPEGTEGTRQVILKYSERPNQTVPKKIVL